MTRLQVLKSRYDLLGKVKCFVELRRTSPGKQWASSVLHPQAPYPECWPLPSLAGFCHPTLPLDSTQACPSPGTRCPPLSSLASHTPSWLVSWGWPFPLPVSVHISHHVTQSPGASSASRFCAVLRCDSGVGRGSRCPRAAMLRQSHTNHLLADGSRRPP